MLDSFFPAKYPEARLWRNLLGTGRSYTFSKPTFSTILSRLKKEGFIERTDSKRKAVWRITQKGLKYIKEEKLREPAKIKSAADGITRIIAFDIPEKERKKRRWIREALLELDFRPLQKSVWIGMSPLPEDFFEDLDLLSLRRHIHLFSIDKKGTIDAP